jgi:K+-sensing histidine kinase KdpD
MALTDKQIQQLYEFVEKKRVLYYDLQLELVDHLGTSIEEEMKKHPELSFEVALQNIYKSFGIFGFAKIVQEKEQALLKANNQKWKVASKEFFTIPKVFMTLCVFASAYYFSQFLEPVTRGVVVMIFWIVLTIVQAFHIFKMRQTRKKKLILTNYLPQSNFSFFFLLFMMFFGMSEIRTNLVFALWITVAFVVELAVIEVSRRIQQQAKILYPEAFE